MDFTVLIEVAIGIMFVWILLALITTQIQDWVAQLLSWKATLLEKSIQGLLGDDEKLKEEFYTHPLIKSLHTNNGNRKPSGNRSPDERGRQAAADTASGGQSLFAEGFWRHHHQRDRASCRRLGGNGIPALRYQAGTLHGNPRPQSMLR